MKKYMRFRKIGVSKTGKTNVWLITAVKTNFGLGHIKWDGKWRRYAFHPFIYTIYEQECLRKIADFCEKESTKARKGWAKR